MGFDMDKLVGLVANSGKTRGFNDDDFSDRLSSQHSVVLLVVFAALISLNQYVRNPITCWAPNHFGGGQVKYATNYCWVKNTYYIPWEDEVPKTDKEDDRRQMIPYYQWIPFILIAQAVLFYAPSTIWHTLNSRAGVDADNILSAAHTFARTDKVETRERTMKMLTQQMDRFLHGRGIKDSQGKCCSCNLRSVMHCGCCHFCGKRFGNYLIAIFLVSKFCYILNVIGQLFMLNIVLSTKFSIFGFDMAKKMLGSADWTEESYVAFPRVTLCDFWIRGQDMSNAHRYTLQCVLPINLYNEKIYLLLWYWMLFVAIISISSFLVWVLRALCHKDRRHFVRNHVHAGFESSSYSEQPVFTEKKNRKVAKHLDKELGKRIDIFTDTYLRQDGTLLLRLVAHNTDHVTTSDLTYSLWKLWNEKNEKRSKKEGDKDKSDVII